MYMETEGKRAKQMTPQVKEKQVRLVKSEKADPT